MSRLRKFSEALVGALEQPARAPPASPWWRSRARRRTRPARGARSAHRRTEPSCSRSSSSLPCSQCHLEQRAGVYLGELLHQFCAASEAMPEKSISLSASSTSRRWSASLRVLRVTFSVARIVRSATSLRMSSSARLVAASMSRSALSWQPRPASPGRCSLASCSCDFGGLASALDDLVRLRAGLLQPLAVLGEDLIGFRAGALGRVDRVFDRLLTATERFADAREGELGEQEHGCAEDEQRPHHQADARFDQEAAAGGEHLDGGD